MQVPISPPVADVHAPNAPRDQQLQDAFVQQLQEMGQALREMRQDARAMKLDLHNKEQRFRNGMPNDPSDLLHPLAIGYDENGDFVVPPNFPRTYADLRDLIDKPHLFQLLAAYHTHNPEPNFLGVRPRNTVANRAKALQRLYSILGAKY